MVELLTFEGLLDFVALELGRDPAVLTQSLRQDPGRSEALADELAGSALARVRLELAAPLRLASGEAPLLAARAELEMKHLNTLLKRQASRLEVPLGPLVLQANASLLGHFQDLIRKRLSPVVDEARGNERVSLLLAQSSCDKLVESGVDEALQSLSAHDPFLPLFLRVVSTPAGRALLGSSVNVARVALAVLGEYRRFPSDEKRRHAFAELATAALLQDVSLMANPAVAGSEHAERSRQHTLDLGLGVAVAGAVGDHHRTRTPSGKPVLHSKMTLTENARVLVVANCFLSLAEKSGKGGGFEAVKGLNYLAGSGYVDKAAVDVVSRLFLPRVKALILARAYTIAENCPQGPSAPVLWPITGDKVPSVFVCNRQGCDNLSEQINFLARNIPFEIDGEEVTTVRKGNYYICPLLSARLRDLYNIISQRSRSGGKA
jgi:hypothetical protein